VDDLGTVKKGNSSFWKRYKNRIFW